MKNRTGPDFQALIAKPLTLLMKHSDHDFEFTAEAMEAIDHLKYMVATAPVLISIDYQQAKLINPLMPRKSNEGLVSVRHVRHGRLLHSLVPPLSIKRPSQGYRWISGYTLLSPDH